LAVYRILTWEKYRKLVLAMKPNIIYYSRDPHPTNTPPWGLKLIFYNGFDGYILTDYAEGDGLHKTKIAIRGTDDQEIPILVEDIEAFVHAHLGNVKVSPIWFPG
jgi:hypothetical protein